MKKSEELSIPYSRLESLLWFNRLRASDVSKELGISKATLCDWKNGRLTPSLKILYRLSKFFDVNIEYFIVENEVKE